AWNIVVAMLTADEPATLEARFAVPVPPTPLAAAHRNARNPLDVNDDGYVSSIDALLVINTLNAHTTTATPANSLSTSPPISSAPYYDTNGDSSVTSIDALLVINYLNNHAAGEGEGEATSPESDESLASLLQLLAEDACQANRKKR